MRLKYLLKLSFLCAITLSVCCPKFAFAQNEFEKALREKMDFLASQKIPEFEKQTVYPNSTLQSIMTPSGWGGYGTYVFGVLGAIYPAPYTQKADMISALGFCFGNAAKVVNFSASVNITRVRTLRDFSANFILSRQIFTGSSISVGGLQLFASSSVSDAPEATFYVAFSHAVQTTPSKTPGYSALNYTIGFGNGRFLHMSPYDVTAGKGKFGTGIFGSISYEVLRKLNVNAEWSGMNLGISTGIRPFENALTLGLGVGNLIRYSGDKPSMIFSVGYPIQIGKKTL